MYAFPGLYMPRVGSRQASLNKLIWCTLLCYLLCSGDKIGSLIEEQHKSVKTFILTLTLGGNMTSVWPDCCPKNI